jgi:uncharacterized protein
MIDKQEVLRQTEQWVKTKLEKDASGHDYWHIKRVVQLAGRIAEQEKCDIFVCEMAAWLHDMNDEKLFPNINKAEEDIFLLFQELGLSEEIQKNIWNAMRDVSFKGKHTIPETMEGKIVQDADRLDAIGAIGIARTFAFGGNRGNLMHDPYQPLEPKNSNYSERKSTTIQHFYEKLLKLKDFMNTKTARQIAEKRHQFMEEFLNQFFLEWKGTDSL